MPTAIKWPEEHDEFLKKKREEGYSSSQIAVALYDEFKVAYSRNAVIGRAHRLGLTQMAPKLAYAGAPRRRRKPSQQDPVAAGGHDVRPTSRGFNGMHLRKTKSVIPLDPDEAPLRAADVEPKHLTIMELTDDTCRWPYGGFPSDDPITFCGHQPIDGLPYCRAHMAINVGRGTASERSADKLPKCEAA